MTRLSQVLFGALVAASLAAFFVAQELKSQPSLIQDFQLVWPVISPNADSRNDAQRVRFRLKEADTVDVAIVDSDSDEVREILSGAPLAAYRYPAADALLGRARRQRRPGAGRRLPGAHHVARPRAQRDRPGRLPRRPHSARRADRLDRAGPRPRPEILPTRTREPARIRINAPVRNGRARMLFFRTDVFPARLAAQRAMAAGTSVVSWNGTDDEGRPVAAGTYLAVAEVRDAAGNIGTSTALDARGLPRRVYGRPLPGRGGITVRRLAAQPPLLPGRVGGPRIALLVDSRNRPYDWTVRRVGGPTIRRGRADRPQVALKPPGSGSGVYIFEAVRGPHRAAVPFAVDDAGHHRVLVVLPLMTWQGRNLVDDDGDGLPNDLPAATP